MAVTKSWVWETAPPGTYIAYITVAAHNDTLVVPLKIDGALFIPNRAQAAADSAFCTYTVAAQTLTFSLVGTTTGISGILIVFGKD